SVSIPQFVRTGLREAGQQDGPDRITPCGVDDRLVTENGVGGGRMRNDQDRKKQNACPAQQARQARGEGSVSAMVHLLRKIEAAGHAGSFAKQRMSSIAHPNPPAPW